MIEPVALEDFFLTFFCAAAVILTGAAYAGLFAWSRLRRLPKLMFWAYGCYGLLSLSVFTLSRVAHLDGFWRLVVAVMLAGYLLAPHGIWYLCAGTHAHEDA